MFQFAISMVSAAERGLEADRKNRGTFRRATPRRLRGEPGLTPCEDTAAMNRSASAYRLDWAALLKRVFAVSVMVCSRSDGGR